MPNPAQIDVAAVRDWLGDGGEIAFLDVREEGQHGAGHPLLAVNLPYSRLELDDRPAGAAARVPGRADRRRRRGRRQGGAPAGGARLFRRACRSRAACRHGRQPGIRCSRAPTCRARPSPRSSRSTGTRRTSPPPNSTGMRREGTKVAVLDSRTVEEFNRFHVPGAVSCPGAELVHRFTDLVPDPDTLVVVSCAGRTRSIIGAQSLINAGVPNRVVSLQGGTQAWRLAGLELERDTGASLGAGQQGGGRGGAAARRRCHQALRHQAHRPRDAGFLARRERDAHHLSCSTCARRTSTRPAICRDRSRPRAASWCRRSTAGSAQEAPASCWSTIPGRARS